VDFLPSAILDLRAEVEKLGRCVQCIPCKKKMEGNEERISCYLLDNKAGIGSQLLLIFTSSALEENLPLLSLVLFLFYL
jgi:hypothetical protein